jgi:arylsulfatase A-like enzyme
MPNVLLVSFDTLRSDVAYSGKFPTINRILARGTSFSTAVASAPLTPLSHASVFSGLQPPNHGLRHLFREKIEQDVPLLAEFFTAAGYRTGAITSCPGMKSWYGFSRGFQSYDDEIPLLADGSDPLQTVDVKLRGTALKRANVVVDRAMDWLGDGGDDPFFLFIHFFDSHWPYEPPEEYGVDIANPYEGEIAFMDHHLGRLLTWMEEKGLADDLAIMFFSDHGEDLEGWYPNDKAGDRGHPEEEGHGALLFDQTQLVALSLSWPGYLPQGAWNGTQVRLVDIAPTLLDLIGVEPTRGMDGESLLPLVRGEQHPHRPAYFETFYREEISNTRVGPMTCRPLAGVRLDDKWKVIWEPASLASGCMVFQLQQDPGEWRPSLALQMAPPVQPEFPAQPFDHAAAEAVLEQASTVIPGASAVIPVIAALSARAELGIALFGGIAKGAPDPVEGIRLDVSFPTTAPGPADIVWIKDVVGRHIDVLTAVKGGKGWTFLCEVEDVILCLGISCIGPGDPQDERVRIILREPAGRMPTVRRVTGSAVSASVLWNRLWGLSWKAAMQIQRGAGQDADEILRQIRTEILDPLDRDLTQSGVVELEGVGLPVDQSASAAKADAILASRLTAMIDRASVGLHRLANEQAMPLPDAQGHRLRGHINALLRRFGGPESS